MHLCFNFVKYFVVVLSSLKMAVLESYFKLWLSGSFEDVEDKSSYDLQNTLYKNGKKSSSFLNTKKSWKHCSIFLPLSSNFFFGINPPIFNRNLSYIFERVVPKCSLSLDITFQISGLSI